MSLVPIDPKNEASVVTLLERAAQWLAEAVHRGEPGEVAAVKAQLATAAEATKQLNLSKEIQLDALEMVRRAEYALGKAIRRGQAEGTIAKQGSIGGALPGSHRGHLQETISRPTEFAGHSELYGKHGFDGVLAIADGADPEQFDDAIDAAKAEGNLSRANVVRKVKGQNEDAPATRQQRADVIGELAAQGYTSHQMAARVGVRDARIRDIAREYGIDIPADRMTGRYRRIDYTAAMESAVAALENWASALPDIDFDEVDWSEADEWVSSLTDSLTELRRFIKQIKEKTHV